MQKTKTHQLLTIIGLMTIATLFVSRTRVAPAPLPDEPPQLAFGYGSSAAVCGNGSLEGDEECDDSNTTDGDGCSSTCTVESGLCSNGFLAYWKLDEGAVSTAIDATGNENTGTLTNMSDDDYVSPDDDTANFNNIYALDFDGTDDFIDIGTTVFDISSSFSISLWFYLNASENAGALAQNRGQATSGTQDGWSLSVVGSQLIFHVEDGGAFDSLQGGTTLSTEQWYHVVATFNTNTGKKTIYLDGTEDYTNTTSGLIGADFTSGRNSTIGALWNDASTQSQHWPGRMDDIRLYSRVLSTSDIASLASGGDASTACVTCGDEDVHITEQCDDGDTDDGDGCSSLCRTETGWTCTGEPSVCDGTCGDSVILGTEECDDGDSNSDTEQDACRTDCRNAYCGDGVRDSTETCDDGNTSNSDSCLATCTEAFCGDGFVQTSLGEKCDPAISNTCTSSCEIVESRRGGGRGPASSSSSSFKKIQPPEGCGDGVRQREKGEECDNGQFNGVTDCSFDCKRRYCGDKIISPEIGEECEPTPMAKTDGSTIYPVPECGEFCLPPVKNDSGRIVEGCTLMRLAPCENGETTASTLPQMCGNGIVDGKEECDQGGICEGGTFNDAYWVDEKTAEICASGGGTPVPLSGDGCSAKCKHEFCGDGVVQGRGTDGLAGTTDDEQCDNGSRCEQSGRRCTADKQCGQGDRCVYDAASDTQCSDQCQQLSCTYHVTIDISELDEGNHTFRLVVTDTRGIADIDATVFTIGSGIAQAQLAPPTSFAQAANASQSQWLAQLQTPAPAIQTKLRTDIDHYVKSEDLAAILTCTVFDERGQPICGLSPNAFSLQLDGVNVPDATFAEAMPAACGDGIVQEPEECDDGNRNGNDGCSPNCEIIETKKPAAPPKPAPKPKADPEPECGNGDIEADEECDDGNLLSGDGCSASCNVERICGDGKQDPDEECDDGNTEDNDGCSSVCRKEAPPSPTCGDGMVDDGEECDNGVHNSDATPNACRTNCMLPRCGDYVPDDTEECDNGLGNSFASDHCRIDCSLPYCGDGVLDSQEECDGGPDCTTDCRQLAKTYCGNGLLEAGEQCDDGNVLTGDGCSSQCLREPNIAGIQLCGNGVQEFGEECDDGNLNDNDLCSSLCRRVIQPVVPPQLPKPAPPPAPAPAYAPPPLASLTPLAPPPIPLGDTGPAVVLVTCAGAAAGYAAVRKRRKR